MKKIGIISGGGKLPLLIGKNLISKNFKVIFFVLEDHIDNKAYNGLDVCSINLTSVKKLIYLLKSYTIRNIILAGNISRPSISDIKFDFQTIKLAKKLLFNNSGDNALLLSIKFFFNESGFSYFNWKKYCPELFANEDYLTESKPSNIALKNLQKAISVFKKFGKLDIGQSLIIQNQIVLGLEAVEGTDNLIIRCKDFKKKGDRGILVKFAKYNQSNIIDIPTIGEKTIFLLKKNNYEGIFLEKNSCLILDKNKTINLANKNNIFISTCNKIV